MPSFPCYDPATPISQYRDVPSGGFNLPFPPYYNALYSGPFAPMPHTQQQGGGAMEAKQPNPLAAVAAGFGMPPGAFAAPTPGQGAAYWSSPSLYQQFLYHQMLKP